MNKLPKRIFFGLLILIGICGILFIAIHIVFRHSLDITNCERHRIFFAKNIYNQVDPMCTGAEGKNDLYSHFIIGKEYYIDIWEFTNSAIKPGDVLFEQGKNLSDVSFWSGQVLDVHTDKETTIGYGFSFDSGMQIVLDQYGKIEKQFETSKYKGFYGTADRISLSDENGVPQLLFDYTRGNEPVLIVVFSKHNNFYVTSINSTKGLPFDEQVLEMLNLD